MSLFGAMNIGVRGLSASQLALNITSQNISNANTDGYSRKRLDLTSSFRRDPEFGQMGFGVEVTNVTRVRDFFIDQQINRQTHELGYHQEIEQSLTRIENIFGEPSDSSLSKVMDRFWDAWGDLSNNPESLAARDVVKANAKNLVDTFHNYSREFRSMRDSKNDDVVSGVDQVNQLLKKIYQLNREIGIVETDQGNKANDARDARDLAVKQLSELINVTTEDSGQGTISVLSNGNLLVSAQSIVTLETSTVTTNRPDGSTLSTVGIRFSDTKRPYIPESGKLRGIMDSRDVFIPFYESQLDEIANGLTEQVNAQHRIGYSLNGTTGIDFFKENFVDENVKRHNELVQDFTFAYDPTTTPYTKDLATPNILLGSFVLKDDNGVTYTEGADYTVNYSTGMVTLLPGTFGAPPQPLPPLTPNIQVSYTYEVPRGVQSIQQTFASTIDLSAAIEDNVINIAASSGETTRAFADTLVIPAVGAFSYIHRSPGPDGTYGTADDAGPDTFVGTFDDLREQASVVQGTFRLSSGATVLTEGTDYFVNYANGQISLLNAAYAGLPLLAEYEAAVPGSDGVTDNKNAVAISELRHTNVMLPDFAGNPTTSINGFYSSLMGQLGIQKNEFTANTESRQFLVDQFEARQSEIAGVSLDEELANLVKFQHTYQASARVISTVDQMLDILMGL